MWKIREIADKVTNVVMNYTEIEAKVREATNDDPWGPTGPVMQEIAGYTFAYESFPEVMGMLWKRMLQDNRSNWRRTYKSLILLNYLVRNGSERVVTSSREHVYDLRSLENYTFIDEMGKDQGINVRHRAKGLIDFIQDDDRLRDERKKAKKTKDKYIGVAADTIMGNRGSYSDSWRGESEDDDSKYKSSPSRSRDKGGYEDSPHDPKDETPEESPVHRNPEPVIPSLQSNIPIVRGNNSTSGPRAKSYVDPAKKVDLGAAAAYRGEQEPTTQSAGQVIGSNSATSGDLLSDLFSSTPTTAGVNQSHISSLINTASDNFADFSSANQQAAANQKQDDFADFESAFTSSAPTNSAASLPFTNPAVAQTMPTIQAINLLNDDSFGDFSTCQPAAVNSAAQVHTSLPFYQPAPLLTPSSANGFQPNPQPTAARPSDLQFNNNLAGSNNVNSAWASMAGTLNIDLDNLGKKNEARSAPSMNQLASSFSTVTLGSPVRHFSPTSPAFSPGGN
ncbi:Clathrin interactor 1 [Halotydeus destructor]|nr:Clathrin interactor 1 [Halotydeus destructor]